MLETGLRAIAEMCPCISHGPDHRKVDDRIEARTVPWHIGICVEIGHTTMLEIPKSRQLNSGQMTNSINSTS